MMYKTEREWQDAVKMAGKRFAYLMETAGGYTTEKKGDCHTVEWHRAEGEHAQAMDMVREAVKIALKKKPIIQK